MPWYITVTLFLLSPFYGALIKDKLLPRMGDRLASLSRKTLSTRIAYLERHLERVSLVWDLTVVLCLLCWAALGVTYHVALQDASTYYPEGPDFLRSYTPSASFMSMLLFYGRLIIVGIPLTGYVGAGLAVTESMKILRRLRDGQEKYLGKRRGEIEKRLTRLRAKLR